jgi:hypothetical protein
MAKKKRKQGQGPASEEPKAGTEEGAEAVGAEAVGAEAGGAEAGGDAGEKEQGGPLMTLAWVGVVFVIGFVILLVLGQLPELQ